VTQYKHKNCSLNSRRLNSQNSPTIASPKKKKPLNLTMATTVRSTKATPITDDYEISNTVLGLGINGKVVQCTNKNNHRKYALKVRIFAFSQKELN
jgi:rRNA maturation endonuclease Nob1